MRRYLYIVEGKTDVDKLKALGAKYVLQTNGALFVSRGNQLYIHLALKVRKVILLADPDSAGRKLIDSIKSQLSEEESQNLIVINVDRKEATGRKKLGIAQMKMKDLSKYISQYIKVDELSEEKEEYSYQDLVEYGLVGPNCYALREYLKKYYPLQIQTQKSLLMSLNVLLISRKELEEKIDEYYGKN